jgi:hypothetical protein
MDRLVARGSSLESVAAFEELRVGTLDMTTDNIERALKILRTFIRGRNREQVIDLIELDQTLQCVHRALVSGREPFTQHAFAQSLDALLKKLDGPGR